MLGRKYLFDGILVTNNPPHFHAEYNGKKVFAPLKDLHFFMDACTVLNGTLAWDISDNRDCTKCLDIDPDTLYQLDNVKEKIA